MLNNMLYVDIKCVSLYNLFTLTLVFTFRWTGEDIKQSVPPTHFNDNFSLIYNVI